MAKKTELLAEAKKLKLDVSAKNTIKEIESALRTISNKKSDVDKNEPKATEPENTSTEPKVVAKSGKRSEKSLTEASEKIAKEERKELTADAEEAEKSKPKHVQNLRTLLERRSKGYRKSSELIETDKTYTLKDALEVATKTSHVKFDASVELHIRLGLDPRQADQNLRDTVLLPAGSGKTLRVAVYVEADNIAVANKAGADKAGGDEFLQELDKGTIDFDILITTPQNMAKLSKYARILGPKGLMPNPKSGTVTTDIAKAVSEAKSGKVEYRVDSTGIIHVAIGKVSFGVDKLFLNARAILDSIKSNRPASLKTPYVLSIYATTSMGPSLPVEISEI